MFARTVSLEVSAMASKRPANSRHPTREEHGGPSSESPRPSVRKTVDQGCDDCAARTAFQAWHSADLSPAYNYEIDFGDWNLIPSGKRAVIELVTASISVPEGESARLRMYTSLGTTPGNFDLALEPQGVAGGQQTLVATHALRAYSDQLIAFNVSRDNATTPGEALIAISGYIADA
jgi:hypothetical protein